MATATYPLLVLLLLVAARAAPGGGDGTTPSAYEMLERYNFPRGILPAGVQGYVLQPDGAFEVYFPRSCEFLLARRWLVRYDASVSGSVADGKLTALQGISVKVAFLWLGVGEVDRAGDKLSFYIGPLATSFPLGDFAESPRCRGYDDFTAAAAA
ncbi:uncharacterized protein LOC120666637 [Panicum virgatum]|uniref:Uncharacterized protein n=1 Tax=Panicum virgatum TaxID=38727 RepID=A0A8T0U2D3_PANVG|nr:uncharacterized protein LOC120666637 [Panicum virgatum]KAG2615263.1 hypothetical protein PVAP13_3NG067400 [Panicum virgatum]